MVLPEKLRAFCASLAILFFLGGVAGLIARPGLLFLVLMTTAAVLVLPAMCGGEAPSRHDLPRIDEQLQRFRGAMLLCFGTSAGLYGVAVTGSAHVQQLASLGVAFWLVAFVLLFFVGYYRTQRRLALDA